ncbi:hypothetical protein [Endozoicomonas ascidiicola]|uniref:hypothetical protein n=1 Tax=Endozoicomonas ascidiicola TaxID=1698521 RepID=UPI000A8CC57B|nr:hypothetical protein [Endozoicomonas ascidiicola]
MDNFLMHGFGYRQTTIETLCKPAIEGESKSIFGFDRIKSVNFSNYLNGYINFLLPYREAETRKVSLQEPAKASSCCAPNQKGGYGNSPIAVKELFKSSTDWAGNPIPKDYLKTLCERGAEVTVASISIPPRAAVPRHHHPGIMFAMIVPNSTGKQGSLTIECDDGKKCTVDKDNPMVVEVINDIHKAKNTSPYPVNLQVFRVMPLGMPNTYLAN